MSTSEPVPCTVTGGDMATQIKVLDCTQRVVAEGFGGVTVDLVPGLYTLQARAGNRVEEKLIVARKDPVRETFGRLAFPSSAPLSSTSRSHEYHMAGATHVSQRVSLGSGDAQIFVFIRDWRSEQYQAQERPFTGPGPQVALLDIDGETIADIGKQGYQSLHEPDPSWGCTVGLSPGNYKLRVRVPKLGATEQIIHAAKGWQTQVFLVRKLDEIAGGPVPDPDTASIFIVREGKGFDPDDWNARQVELARLGLVSGRKVLALNHQSLGLAFTPMLGILYGHMLLLDEREPDLELLGDLVRMLRNAVGKAHPDVEALALALGERDFVFETPPMLSRSMDRIIAASHETPSLVPPRSLTAQAALNRIGHGAWLTWLVHEAEIKKHQRRLRALSFAIPDASIGFESTLESLEHEPPEPRFGSLEMAIIAAALPKERDVPLWAKRAPKSFYIANLEGASVEELHVDADTTRKLAEGNGVPAALVKKALRSVVAAIGIKPWPLELSLQGAAAHRDKLLQQRSVAESCTLDALARAEHAAAAFWEVWLFERQPDETSFKTATERLQAAGEWTELHELLQRFPSHLEGSQLRNEVEETRTKLAETIETLHQRYGEFLKAPNEDTGADLLREVSSVPSASFANYLCARIYGALKRHDFAEHHYLLAVLSRPLHLPYVVLLAYEQAERQVSAALSSLAGAMRINKHPRLWVHRANFAWSLWVSGECKELPVVEATRALGIAKEQAPELLASEIALAYAVAAVTTREAEGTQAALKIVRKGIEAAPDDDQLHELLGYLLLEQGELSDANAAFERTGNRPWATLAAAEIGLARGDIDAVRFRLRSIPEDAICLDIPLGPKIASLLRWSKTDDPGPLTDEMHPSIGEISSAFLKQPISWRSQMTVVTAS